jgi:hypothetical protein
MLFTIAGQSASVLLSFLQILSVEWHLVQLALTVCWHVDSAPPLLPLQARAARVISPTTAVNTNFLIIFLLYRKNGLVLNYQNFL